MTIPQINITIIECNRFVEAAVLLRNRMIAEKMQETLFGNKESGKLRRRIQDLKEELTNLNNNK